MHHPARHAGLLRRGLVLCGITAGLMASIAAAAPTPSSGTLSTANPSLTWAGGLIFGANLDESTCNENVTCETFTLTLAPGDYTGKRIQVDAGWLLPANDYDLYVHEGSISGAVVSSSASGTTNAERANIAIDPPIVTSPQVYAVRMVAFSVAPGDLYAGTAALVATPPPRIATHLPGTLRFSQNVALKAPVASSDGEPSLRVDVRGNCYVGGIRGVPAGVDLWRFDLDPSSSNFDPGMQNPTYLGQPDAFLQQEDPNDPMTGGADGGGDIDISVSFPTAPSAIPVVTITSLALANISSAVSTDRGENFTLSPATAIVPADDRQWNESTGNSRVYLVYRAPIPATGLFVARSDDQGATYPITGVVSPSGSSPGYLDVDHASGRVYVSHQNSSALFVGSSSDGGLTWRNNTVDNSTQHGTLFDPVKVGADGTVYAVWSDGKNIYLAHSSDGGTTFSEKVRVNDNATYKTNLFPWLEAGSAGRVCVVWYGTTSLVNDDSADWVVLYSQTLDAMASNPTFRQQVVSDHVIHGSNISTGGLTGSANRNLIDYFQVALDPQGAAVIAFTDDHNDFDGHTYVTRQLDGTSLDATANGNGMVVPSFPPALPEPDPDDPEVIDFLHDAVVGLLQPIPTDNPFDILWIDYDCDFDGSGFPMLEATMKVSGLDPIPPAGNWRINFTANAPGGLSDRGDQFFLRASTASGGPAFEWGTAVRNGDGSLSYTVRGTADAGTMDVPNDQITMAVRFDRLTPFVTHGPPVTVGSLLHGLRGQAFTQGANAITDMTRGGTSFQCRSTTGVPDDGDAASGRPTAAFLGAPNPNPSRRSQVEFGLDRSSWVELLIVDAGGRRVRTLQAGSLSAGRYVRFWDGRTDRFGNAAPGVYFYVLRTAAGTQSAKVTLMR